MKKVLVSFRLDADLYDKLLGNKTEAVGTILNNALHSYVGMAADIAEIKRLLTSDAKPATIAEPIRRRTSIPVRGAHPTALKFGENLRRQLNIPEEVQDGIDPSPESLEEDRKELERRDNLLKEVLQKEEDKITEITPAFSLREGKDA